VVLIIGICVAIFAFVIIIVVGVLYKYCKGGDGWGG
jgi:hypothetical protein